MQTKVTITPEANKIIQTIMHNIEDLNRGDEIGAWLLGDWTVKKEELTLLLDTVVIPKQDVSKAEVDISPASMIDTIKELGQESCNRIKAHWHIHPFGKGSTDWSGIDEAKITDFMQPEKGREIFVFLLSSEDQIKARIEINATATILGQKTTIKRTIDDQEVHIQGQEDEKLIEEIKARITEKVTRSSDKRLDNWNKGWTRTVDNDWRRYDRYDSYQKTLTDTVAESFHIHRKKTKVKAYLENDFADFVKHSGMFETTITTQPLETSNNHITTLTFQVDTKKQAVELADELEAELTQADELWEEEAKAYEMPYKLDREEL